MNDIKILKEFIESAVITYGILGTLAFIIGGIIIYFFLQRLVNFAKVDAESSLKRLESALKIENEKILERYRKEIQLLFRDEEIRKGIILNLISISDQVRIELYKKVYFLFFEILSSFRLIQEKKDAEKSRILRDLDEKLIDIRKEILINSIHLGKLTEYLLNVQIALCDDLIFRNLEDKSNAFYREYEQRANTASKNLELAELWIVKEMGTTKTYNTFELDTETIKIISEQRNSLIKEIFTQK